MKGRPEILNGATNALPDRFELSLSLLSISRVTIAKKKLFRGDDDE
jgi:hypothetical protein